MAECAGCGCDCDCECKDDTKELLALLLRAKLFLVDHRPIADLLLHDIQVELDRVR